MSFADLGRGSGGSYSRVSQTDTPASGSTSEEKMLAEVARSIFQMTTTVTSFKRQIDVLGTNRDTVTHRTKIHSTADKLGISAKEISSRLKTLSHSAGLDKSQKLAHTKLLKDFQAVLKNFQEAQKLFAERENTFVPIPDSAAKKQTQSLLDDRSSLSDKEIAESQQRQQQIAIDNTIEFNDAIYQEREEGLLGIRAQITEVNEIFKDLAVIVQEQGEQLDDIEANIVSADGSINQGAKELSKASNYQKRTRNKIMCLLAIIIIIGVVIVLVILKS